MSSYCSVTKVQLIIFIMGAEVVAFSSYAAAAAGALPAAVGGALVGAASERLALRRPSLPRLPPPAARTAPQLPGIADRGASPHVAAAWGATVRTAAAYGAARALRLWSGVGDVEAAALASASSAALPPGALPSLAALCLWAACAAFGASVGSALQPVGVTGSIATGKSTVSGLLRGPPSRDGGCSSSSSGPTPFAVVDVDGIGHDILVPGKLPPSQSAYGQVLDAFGEEILADAPPSSGPDLEAADGGDPSARRIVRRKLGDVIFRDPSKRRVLNRITHPLISSIMVRRAVLWKIFPRVRRKEGGGDRDDALVAVDIPLLFEVGLKMKVLFGLKVVVACTPESQLKRLMDRNDDLTEEQCRQRIASQIPVKDKMQMADVVIWNEGTMDDLRREVERAREEIGARVRGWGISVPRMTLFFAAGFVARALFPLV